MLRKMMVTTVTCALLAGATQLHAQDSISKLSSSLPGDAVDPYAVGEQVNAYAVDLVSFQTSWGNTFGIAPIIKSSKSSSVFTNSLIGSQALSATFKENVPFHSSTYDHWFGPGFGVNDDNTINDPGAALSAGTNSLQFCTAFAESGTTDSNASYNGVVGAIVNFNRFSNQRMYVTRYQVASNGFNDAENRAQFGFGQVDCSGNVHFRGDDFGTTGPNPLVGNNIFRVNMAARAPGVQNVIDNAGGSDGAATDWIVQQNTDVHNPPSAIPASIAGRPVYMGSNFSGEYVYESAPLTTSTSTAHRAPSCDHRGSVFFHKSVVFANSVGSGAMLARNSICTLVKAMTVWGVDANGAVVANAVLEWPSVITDNDPFEPYTLNNVGESLHYLSQTAFRGGNSQVAVGEDQAGRVIVATPADAVSIGGSDNPFNTIVVARFDKSDIPGTLEWTTCGYVDGSDDKSILDGPNGNVIGRMAGLFEVTGGVPGGPSVSAPMIDSVGNIYFLSAVELFSQGGSDFDTALLKAVYDPTTFSYQLELVLELGQVFRGINSGTEYQVSFLGIADNNSVSSGTAFSGNILQCAVNNMNPANLSTSDPKTLGGLVFSCSITYDADGDGNFDPSLGVDEEYNALMMIMPKGRFTVSPFDPAGTGLRK